MELLIRLLAQWWDMLRVAAEVGLAAHDGEAMTLGNQSDIALTRNVGAVEELQESLGPFLRRYADRHPGRITSNGLGTLDIGHSDH